MKNVTSKKLTTKWNKFIERHNLSRLTQKERENLKRFMSVKYPLWLKTFPWFPGAGGGSGDYLEMGMRNLIRGITMF